MNASEQADELFEPDELFDLRTELRQRAEREFCDDVDALILHLSPHRSVPSRIGDAIAAYIKDRALPAQLARQDVLDLLCRVSVAAAATAALAALECGDDLPEPLLVFARHVRSGLLKKQLPKLNRAGFLQYLLVDLYDQVPYAFIDNAMQELLRNFRPEE